MATDWKPLKNGFSSIRNRLVSIKSEIEKNVYVEEEIEARNGELRSKEMKLAEVQNSIEEKEKELGGKTKLVSDCCLEFESKREELETLMKSIDEINQELDLFKEAKEKEYEELFECLRDCYSELENKKTEVTAVKAEEVHLLQRVGQCKVQLQSETAKYTNLVQSIKEHDQNLKSKRALLISVDKCLESKTKLLDEFRMKERYCQSRFELLNTQEEQFRARVEELNQKEKQLNTKEKEFCVRVEQFNETKEQHEAKEKELCSRVDEFNQKKKQLDTKENEFETRVEELNQKEKQFNAKEKELCARVKEFNQTKEQLDAKEKEICSTLALSLNAGSPSSPSSLRDYQAQDQAARLALAEAWRLLEESPRSPLVAMSQIDMQLVRDEFNQKKKQLDSKEKELCSRVQEFNQKEKQFNAKDKEFETRVQVFDQKKQQIYVNEKEEPDDANNQSSRALNLHSLAHKLDSRRKFVSDVMERCHNLEEVAIHMISQNKKQGYGFLHEKFVEKCIIMFEELMGRDSRMISSEVLDDATRLAVEWKDVMKVSTCNTLVLLGFLEFVAAFKLVASFDKAQIFELFKDIAEYKLAPKIFQELGLVDKLSDLVTSLIEGEQYIAATRFACSFQMTENIPVVTLLSIEIRNREILICNSEQKRRTSPEQSGENKDIAALYAVLECIADFELESEFSIQPIMELIHKNIKDSESTSRFCNGYKGFGALKCRNKQQRSLKRARLQT